MDTLSDSNCQRDNEIKETKSPKNSVAGTISKNLGKVNVGLKIVIFRSDLNPKLFWVQKNFASKKNVCQKILRFKNFWVHKIFWSNKFGSNKFLIKNLGSKNFLIKNLGSKQILGSKEFCPKKILGPKKVWVINSFGSKKIWLHNVLV